MSRLALLGGLALLLSGCAGRARVAASLDDARRWTAVVIRAEEGVGRDEVRLVEAEARAALASTGRFLLLPAATAEPAADGPWRGGPPPRLLIELARASGADALAVVGVRWFDPYPPARVGLTLEVHSTETGALLYSNEVVLEAGASGGLDPSVAMGTLLRGGCAAPARLLSRGALAREACVALVGPIAP